MSDTNSLVLNVLAEVRGLATAVSGITRQLDSVETRLDRVDQRLDKVEEQTSLIPWVAESLGATLDDITDHEVRLLRLENPA
jgi:hypothetical protein